MLSRNLTALVENHSVSALCRIVEEVNGKLIVTSLNCVNPILSSTCSIPAAEVKANITSGRSIHCKLYLILSTFSNCRNMGNHRNLRLPIVSTIRIWLSAIDDQAFALYNRHFC